MGGFAALLGIVCMVIAASSAGEAAITCGTVASTVSSCIPYVQHQVQTPPPGCCTGLHSLDNLARTTPDRQAVCSCFKAIAGTLPHADYAAGNSLIARCGITDIPYKLSPSLDCTRIK